MKPSLSLIFCFILICIGVSTSAVEDLERGVVAIKTRDGVYVGWRLLAKDPRDVGFNVLRYEGNASTGKVVNKSLITDSCNIIDKDGMEGFVYSIQVVANGREIERSKPVKVMNTGGNYVSIKLQGDYVAQKVGLGDFDGDGRLDYLVKQPDFNTDPYQQPGYWKKSETTYRLEAYTHEGKFLWSHDMGWSIEAGVWYSPIVVYDLNGDGKAEVFCKAGDGDPREPTGHVKSGPEYCIVLDGMTGKVLKKWDWPSRDGFEDYNYYCRNLLGIAYIDGRRPHLIVQRGTYTIIKIQAYDPQLNLVWYWEASGEYKNYRGQGMHGMHAADVDEDGKDEIVIGAAVIDDNGKGLWNMRMGHPDVCYVADVDPKRSGLEIFYGIEPGKRSNTVCLVEAKTGKMIWGSPEITVHVHGQGMVGDIDAGHPGMECYAGEAKGGSNYWLYAADGTRLSDRSLGELSPKAIYWLDGETKVYIVGNRILRYPSNEVGRIEGRIVAIADCVGDWREEVITALRGEIRIYTTTVAATTRRVCLMQDRLYRTDVAMQTMGYFYPPQLCGKLLPDVKVGAAKNP
ncbi:MAG: silent information regulator protein Sir2 [Verrucomicrobiae bacterium]|nr:silent information regulator protein Sir2 [Verrucomicrobiae bacterium]